MNGQIKSFDKKLLGPYSKNDIPKFDIDYRELVAYAHKQCKKVFELSDAEKNMFIHNSNMNEVREKALYELGE